MKLNGVPGIESKVLFKGWRNKGELRSLIASDVEERKLSEIEETLIKLGLSKKETKVYIFLAMNGEKKASEISSATSLNRTETYKVLMKLQRMGLVSVIIERPLKFAALPLEDTLNLLIESKKMSIKVLEEEKDKLIRVWRSLPKINSIPVKREFFQVLEGYENIILKAKDIIEESEKKLCATFVLETHLYKFYYAGLLDYIEEAAERGVKAMALVVDSPALTFFIRDLRKCRIKYIKYGAHEIPSFIISDDEKLLLFLEQKFNGCCDERTSEPLTLYTNCTVLVKALNKIFCDTWEKDDQKN
ncbi:MAG: helix-turn-helix domain-containing protein [Candidatus Bathyarchaeia archaeon]